MMRIGRPAAKHYVTDDVIAAMADRIAATVAQHRDQFGGEIDHRGRRVVDLDTERRRRRASP